MEKRTEQQNRSLHLLFRELANILNESGLDMQKVLEGTMDIWWTDKMVKEYLWRPVQKAMYQKKSTTELDKKEEIDRVYDVICRHLADRYGLTCPQFPSFENQ
jgi:hypothetical protein